MKFPKKLSILYFLQNNLPLIFRMLFRFRSKSCRNTCANANWTASKWARWRSSKVRNGRWSSCRQCAATPIIWSSILSSNWDSSPILRWESIILRPALDKTERTMTVIGGMEGRLLGNPCTADEQPRSHWRSSTRNFSTCGWGRGCFCWVYQLS